MGREIKFRAWDNSGKRGMSDPFHLGAEFIYFNGSEEPWSFYADEVTVEQFTGLKDEEGQEIFEGDIIQYQKTHSKSFRRVVEFFGGAFGYRDLTKSWIELGHRNYEFRVIGNIHSNPELLKGGR